MKKIIFIFFLITNVFAQKIIVISDLNGSYGSKNYGREVKNAVAKIKELKPDMVLITGDMVAGMKKGLDYKGMWDSFFSLVVEPLRASNLMIAPTPGNHDASAYSSYKTERRIYGEYWPESESSLQFVDNENYPLHYSFKLKDTLFISLDVTMVGKLPAYQKKWLKQQLKDTSAYNNIIVFSHVPLYPFAINRENDAMFDTELEDLLNKYKVKYYVSGHHHTYFPGQRGDLKLISSACLGSGPRVLIGDTVKSKKSFTVLNLEGDKFKVKAMLAPSFTTSVDHDGLPEIVNPGKWEIERID
jgi:acid phosphatase type 7